jgi:hypothetical protein
MAGAEDRGISCAARPGSALQRSSSRNRIRAPDYNSHTPPTRCRREELLLGSISSVTWWLGASARWINNAYRLRRRRFCRRTCAPLMERADSEVPPTTCKHGTGAGSLHGDAVVHSRARPAISTDEFAKISADLPGRLHAVRAIVAQCRSCCLHPPRRSVRIHAAPASGPQRTTLALAAQTRTPVAVTATQCVWVGATNWPGHCTFCHNTVHGCPRHPIRRRWFDRIRGRCRGGLLRRLNGDWPRTVALKLLNTGSHGQGPGSDDPEFPRGRQR